MAAMGHGPGKGEKLNTVEVRTLRELGHLKTMSGRWQHKQKDWQKGYDGFVYRGRGIRRITDAKLI